MSALDPIVAVFDEHVAAGAREGLDKANAVINERWPKLSGAEYAAAWSAHFKTYWQTKLDAQLAELMEDRKRCEAVIGNGGEFVGDMGEALWAEHFRMREDFLGEKRQ